MTLPMRSPAMSEAEAVACGFDISRDDHKRIFDGCKRYLWKDGGGDFPVMVSQAHRELSPKEYDSLALKLAGEVGHRRVQNVIKAIRKLGIHVNAPSLLKDLDDTSSLRRWTEILESRTSKFALEEDRWPAAAEET